MNWGDEVVSTRDTDRHPGCERASLDDWVTSRGKEDEEKVVDWLFSSTADANQQEKRMKQMKLEIPKIVKKAGKGE